MNQTIFLETGQNISDICLQAYGSLENLYELCSANGLSLNERVKPGTELIIPNIDNVDEFAIKVLAKSKPATDIAGIANNWSNDFGIGYMKIEESFIIR